MDWRGQRITSCFTWWSEGSYWTYRGGCVRWGGDGSDRGHAGLVHVAMVLLLQRHSLVISSRKDRSWRQKKSVKRVKRLFCEPRRSGLWFHLLKQNEFWIKELRRCASITQWRMTPAGLPGVLVLLPSQRSEVNELTDWDCCECCLLSVRLARSNRARGSSRGDEASGGERRDFNRWQENTHATGLRRAIPNCPLILIKLCQNVHKVTAHTLQESDCEGPSGVNDHRCVI